MLFVLVLSFSCDRDRRFRRYAVAGNLNDNTHEGGTGNIGDCARFAFHLSGAQNQSMTQNMIYFDDDTSSSNATTATWYYWNLTNWVADDEKTPYWKNNDDVDEMYNDFWTSVFAVGHSGGKRWCGAVCLGGAAQLSHGYSSPRWRRSDPDACSTILRRFGFYLCGPAVTVTRRGQVRRPCAVFTACPV